MLDFFQWLGTLVAGTTLAVALRETELRLLKRLAVVLQRLLRRAAMRVRSGHSTKDVLPPFIQ